MNKKQILHDHPFTIYQQSDGRWRTYVKQEDGRKKILGKGLFKVNIKAKRLYSGETEVYSRIRKSTQDFPGKKYSKRASDTLKNAKKKRQKR